MSKLKGNFLPDKTQPQAKASVEMIHWMLAYF